MDTQHQNSQTAKMKIADAPKAIKAALGRSQIVDEDQDVDSFVKYYMGTCTDPITKESYWCQNTHRWSSTIDPLNKKNKEE